MGKRYISVIHFLVIVYVFFAFVETKTEGAAVGEKVVKDWELMWDYAPNQLLVKKAAVELYAMGELEFFLLRDRESDIYPVQKQKGYHQTR